MLNTTLKVVMNELKYEAEMKKLCGELPAVRCLAAQLNQVFMNLILNAAHAIEQRGVITASTGVGRRLRVWIPLRRPTPAAAIPSTA